MTCLTPGKSNGNNGVLHIPQRSSISGTSPSDCLMSYPRHSLEGVLPRCREAVGVFYSLSRLGKNVLAFVCVCLCVSVCACVFVCLWVDIRASLKYLNHMNISTRKISLVEATDLIDESKRKIRLLKTGLCCLMIIITRC